MSAPSLSDQLALVAADPTLAGHPVVAGLVVAVDAELATLRTQLAALQEEIVDLRRQRDRHSGNSGQPPSQDGPAAPPRTRSRRRSRGRKPGVHVVDAGVQAVDLRRQQYPMCGGGAASRARNEGLLPGVV